MNHKYLHAANACTKESEGLRWENFFSHEKQCFELQCIFNFISAIANLKSQCPLPKPFRNLTAPRGRGVRVRVDVPSQNRSLQTHKKVVPGCCVWWAH